MVANRNTFVKSRGMVELLDGKKVSEKILGEVKTAAAGKNLQLAVVQVGKNKVSETYIAEKQKVGEDAGIAVRVLWLPVDISREDLEKEVAQVSADASIQGVIVQLPLPKEINREAVLNRIPVEKDVDVLSEQALEEFRARTFPIVPPTVGAVQALFEAYNIELQNKQVVLVGQGRLVGLPLSMWLQNQGVQFEVATKETENVAELTQNADIIISGVGKPNLITGDMVKQGAVVIDAGTSVEDGKTSGDVDFASVSKKASYITPVPGGVGPLTVACLFRNLVTLAEK